MSGTMLVELNVQRTMKRAELWAVFMTFSRCSDPVVICTDNLGVVQAPRRGTKPELGQNTRMGDWWRSRWRNLPAHDTGGAVEPTSQVCQSSHSREAET